MKISIRSSSNSFENTMNDIFVDREEKCRVVWYKRRNQLNVWWINMRDLFSENISMWNQMFVWNMRNSFVGKLEKGVHLAWHNEYGFNTIIVDGWLLMHFGKKIAMMLLFFHRGNFHSLEIFQCKSVCYFEPIPFIIQSLCCIDVTTFYKPFSLIPMLIRWTLIFQNLMPATVFIPMILLSVCGEIIITKLISKQCYKNKKTSNIFFLS